MHALSVHSEYHHEHEKLGKEGELKDRVITKEANCDILVKLRHIRTDVICSCEKMHSLLETPFHEWEL